MRIDEYIDDLIKREGGYVDHPSDRGGPTNWGVTEAVARAYGYRGPMQAMPRTLAEEIYFKRYWTEPRFNQVEQLSPILADEMLDTGVNMGTQWPGRFLQRALNVLNERGTVYPDLTVDGRIGAMTLDALRRYLARRKGEKGVLVMLRLMDAQQAMRYLEIAEGKQTQEDFMFGWVAHRIGNAGGQV